MLEQVQIWRDGIVDPSLVVDLEGCGGSPVLAELPKACAKINNDNFV